MATKDFVNYSPTSGSNNGSIDITVPSNTQIQPRNTAIVVTGGGVSKTCIIVQKNAKAIFSISNIRIASEAEAVISDINPKYNELIDRDVKIYLKVGSSGLITMLITFDGISKITSAKGDSEDISTIIQNFNLMIKVSNIWIYGGGAHVTVTGYDKVNTPFECYISLIAQMM